MPSVLIIDAGFDGIAVAVEPRRAGCTDVTAPERGSTPGSRADAWASGGSACLGITVPVLPNMFLTHWPGLASECDRHARTLSPADCPVTA